MELDVYLPSLNLAFEYQGQHHFCPSYLLDSPEGQQSRDRYKRMLCLKSGLILIEIPYWWDHRLESVIAAIRAHHPVAAKFMIVHDCTPVNPQENSCKQSEKQLYSSFPDRICQQVFVARQPSLDIAFLSCPMTFGLFK